MRILLTRLSSVASRIAVSRTRDNRVDRTPSRAILPWSHSQVQASLTSTVVVWQAIDLSWCVVS